MEWTREGYEQENHKRKAKAIADQKALRELRNSRIEDMGKKLDEVHNIERPLLIAGDTHKRKIRRLDPREVWGLG